MPGLFKKKEPVSPEAQQAIDLMQQSKWAEAAEKLVSQIDLLKELNSTLYDDAWPKAERAQFANWLRLLESCQQMARCSEQQPSKNLLVVMESLRHGLPKFDRNIQDHDFKAISQAMSGQMTRQISDVAGMVVKHALKNNPTPVKKAAPSRAAVIAANRIPEITYSGFKDQFMIVKDLLLAYAEDPENKARLSQVREETGVLLQSRAMLIPGEGRDRAEKVCRQVIDCLEAINQNKPGGGLNEQEVSSRIGGMDKVLSAPMPAASEARPVESRKIAQAEVAQRGNPRPAGP